MIFVELIVNRPIRRTFSHLHESPPPDGYGEDDALAEFDPLTDTLAEQHAALQLYHYHLPVELENVVVPGHLVWAPFGPQKVQGFVVRRCDHAPVPTRAILRLARTEPVLTEIQIALAGWIADYYVAPLAETVKLFVPPGLLSKDEDAPRVRAKREWQVQLAVDPATALARLPLLGRENQQSRVLEWLLAQTPTPFSLATVQQACGLKSAATLHTLAKQKLVQINADGQVMLSAAHDAVVGACLTLRGANKYKPVLETLATLNKPLWKSELQAQVAVDLQMLRELQHAGLIELTERIRLRDPLAGRTYRQTVAPLLTAEQTAVWHRIQQRAFADDPPLAPADELSADQPPVSDLVAEIPLVDTAHLPTVRPVASSFRPATHSSAAQFLLHGVTGSGKTEIYLRAIAETLALGKQAIVLVPEIALTPQTVARFAGRFPDRVTVIHSGLSTGERYDVWRQLRDGVYDVVVGPRSALFAPLARLGLIIIDEEHESSYKQQAEAWGSFTVFYDARIVARQLSRLTGSVLLMGSATPSLEHYSAAQRGDLILLELLHRVMGHQPPDANRAPGMSRGAGQATEGTEAPYTDLPPVEIVDMRQELRAGHRSILSRTLLAELHSTLDAGQQAIFFLNRRGTRTFVMCRDCGMVQACERCDVPLTYHENTEILICHHCNQRYPIPEQCPACNSKRIKYFGSGTQRLEEVIQQVAPHARLMRWDADTAKGKGSHEEILRRFAAQEADILVGTQMIAKGLDFPLVTLVGVVAADVGLYLPDFRSGERTFQLLTQVAGRAGRSAAGGRVVLQTYKPEHYAIQAAARHDYHAFYAREIDFRREHGYPPIRRMARLIYWDKKLTKAQDASEQIVAVLRHRLQTMGLEGDGATVFGPAPAFFARYRGYYRWQVLLRAADPAAVLRGITIPFGWRIDIDPISML